MQGLSTKSYLTKTLLEEIIKKPITNELIAKLVCDGSLIKHFSYYRPTVKFLKKLNIIPAEIKIKNYDKLAKQSSFLLKDICEIFDCPKDTAKLIIDKYFIRKFNYLYRNDELLEILEEGGEVIKI